MRMLSRYITGGPARHVTQLHDLGADFRTLLVTGSPEDDEHDLVDEARSRGIDIVRIDELGRSVKPWSDAAATAKLVSLMRKFRPDIVDTHTAKAGAAGRVAAMIAGVPVRIHTFHGHVFAGYFGPLKSHAFIRVERMLAGITTRVIALSETQRKEIVDEYRICSDARVRVVPLGLDLTYVRAEHDSAGDAVRAELGATGLIVAIVGRLAPIKRHDVFLAAAAHFLQQRPDTVFAIVGGGPEERKLRTLADEFGIAHAVRFLGYRNDLDRIYAAADVVTLCSDNEGTPVSLIEALAAGVAVVATDVGGVTDVLCGGDYGTLVPAGDAVALARAWHQARPIPEQAREEIRARYSAERLRHEMADMYRELMSGRHR